MKQPVAFVVFEIILVCIGASFSGVFDQININAISNKIEDMTEDALRTKEFQVSSSLNNC